MRKFAGGFLFLVFLFFTPFLKVDKVQAQKNATVDSMNAGLAVKVSPGELLPISVKILNFGGGKRVDVLVTYSIFSSEGVPVYRASETIAVETTNAFVKTIQIPFDTEPGIYTAKTSLLYQGQEVPATTGFSFRVERKMLGLFQSEFLFFGGGSLLLSLLMIVIGYNLVKRRTSSRSDPIDYGHIPHDDRVFYELISDTVLEMRQKVGDRALKIASRIEGLEIDTNTGRIVRLKNSPSKIIAELVAGYEKTLGKKVSFSFREPNREERRSI